MRRPRRSYPQHPLPLLTALGCTADLSLPPNAKLSPRHHVILKHLRGGARVLLDMDQRRALIYSFKRGIEHLAEITLRALSALVKAGMLVACAREGRLVHYTYAAPASA